MDAERGGGGFGLLIREAYLELPIVTRTYITICFVVALAVYSHIISPYQLYFNTGLIFQRGQYWRLISSFFFFGKFGFPFLLNMLFNYRYCRLLEENSFRNRTADFVVMFIFGSTFLILFATFFFDVFFLGQSLTTMLVYIWARRNPFIPMSFFGLITFNAPYLPWVLVGFSVLIGNSVTGDLLGIAVGHIYYFLEDVFPRQPNGVRLLKTPVFLKNLLDPNSETDGMDDLLNTLGDEQDTVDPVDRPGGFDWGQGVNTPSQGSHNEENMGADVDNEGLRQRSGGVGAEGNVN